MCRVKFFIIRNKNLYLSTYIENLSFTISCLQIKILIFTTCTNIVWNRLLQMICVYCVIVGSLPFPRIVVLNLDCCTQLFYKANLSSCEACPQMQNVICIGGRQCQEYCSIGSFVTHAQNISFTFNINGNHCVKAVIHRCREYHFPVSSIAGIRIQKPSCKS